ncbi:hypothetical protein [Streptomyces sp. NPDC050264]|uniref:hypothetical protein n=1 Tax=Streptomyces sp. NPDC050264 TaxID=3155038 RepID=UPI00343DACCD
MTTRRQVRAWVAGAWLVLVAGGWVATRALEGGIAPTSGPQPAGHAPPSPTPITLPGACPSPPPAPPAYTPRDWAPVTIQFTDVLVVTDTAAADNCVVVTTR